MMKGPACVLLPLKPERARVQLQPSEGQKQLVLSPSSDTSPASKLVRSGAGGQSQLHRSSFLDHKKYLSSHNKRMCLPSLCRAQHTATAHQEHNRPAEQPQEGLLLVQTQTRWFIHFIFIFHKDCTKFL